MAFLRAWAEGLDLLRAWRQYLDPDGRGGDLRHARQDRLRLVGRLRTVAQRQGRGDLATLLRRDPEAMADGASAQPTLDEFRELQPADFYSEAELLALYQAEHGRADAGSAARRRQRLRARLVAALQVLETLAQPARPQPGDRLALWLDARVAQRLAAAGLDDIASLQARIAQQGARWHQGIARLGAVGAGRVAQWLDAHRDSLGAPAVPPPAGAAAAPGIVPLERWAPPAALAGRRATEGAGTPPSGLAAADDAQAVQAWLARFSPGSATWRAYRKAAERWVLWATVARGCAMSSLGEDDLPAFAAFLANPGKGWTAPRCTARLAPGWRPFEAGLAAPSVAMTLGIVRALSRWLVQQGYLDGAAWAGNASAGRAQAPVKPRTLGVDGVEGVQPGRNPLPRLDSNPAPPHPGWRATRRSAGNSAPVRRLAASHWATVQHWLSALPDGRGPRRTAAVLALAVGSGLRLSELAAARWDWLEAPVGGQAGERWHLCIAGTGLRARRVPLAPAVVVSLQRWRDAGGLADGGSRPVATPGDAPMFRPLAAARPLSATRLYEVVQEAFRACAAAVAGRDAATAATLAQASTGWLRHSFGVHAAQAGASSLGLQQWMGYSRPDTAAAYRRLARLDRAAASPAARV